MIDEDEVMLVKYLKTNGVTRLLGREGREILSEWNTLPYGEPGHCLANLLVIVDGSVPLPELFERTLIQLMQTCKGITNNVIIYVAVDDSWWTKAWYQYEEQFSCLEEDGLEIRIVFNQEKNITGIESRSIPK